MDKNQTKLAGGLAVAGLAVWYFFFKKEDASIVNTIAPLVPTTPISTVSQCANLPERAGFDKVQTASGCQYVPKAVVFPIVPYVPPVVVIPDTVEVIDTGSNIFDFDQIDSHDKIIEMKVLKRTKISYIGGKSNVTIDMEIANYTDSPFDLSLIKKIIVERVDGTKQNGTVDVMFSNVVLQPNAKIVVNNFVLIGLINDSTAYDTSRMHLYIKLTPMTQYQLDQIPDEIVYIPAEDYDSNPEYKFNTKYFKLSDFNPRLPEIFEGAYIRDSIMTGKIYHDDRLLHYKDVRDGKYYKIPMVDLEKLIYAKTRTDFIAQGEHAVANEIYKKLYGTAYRAYLGEYHYNKYKS
jgi:hypothetical protein